MLACLSNHRTKSISYANLSSLPRSLNSKDNKKKRGWLIRMKGNIAKLYDNLGGLIGV